MAEAENDEEKLQRGRKPKNLTRTQRMRASLHGTLKLGFVLFLVVHVAMIVIAGLNFNNCPVDPEIPSLLLAEGIIGIMSKLISLCRDRIIKHIKLSPILSLIATVELAIFIIWSYYIYKEFEPDYDPASGSGRFCDKTTYLLSFVYVTAVYVLLLILMTGILCFVMGILALDRYLLDEEDEKSQVETQTSSTPTSRVQVSV